MKLMAKIALVTGSSRGIGAATALTLAQQGCDVAVNYLARADAARAVAQQIESLGRRAITVQADVSNYAQVQRMIETTVRELGGLHIVVNNAGYSSHGGIEQLSPEEWERMLAVTLTGAFYCAKLAVPYMRHAGWGRIVNLCSLRAMTGSAHGPHYAAAKAGLIGLTKSLALELAPHNITVNAVAPGYTDTEMNKRSLAEKGEQIRASIPLRRIARPEEIASVIAFLCSDAAGYITGETLNVNGGIYMR
jgi:3-oxoacyl-[acyl-carrier protein] reductase